MTIYRVSAQRITTNAEGWTGSEQIPTFFLDAEIQGIRDVEHATKIAESIIGPGAKACVCVDEELSTWATRGDSR